MKMTTTTTFPQVTDYTPLEEHETATPAAFFGARPVLHKHLPGCRVLTTKSELAALINFGVLGQALEASSNGTDGPPESEVKETLEQVDAFVNSQDLTLASRQGEDARVLRIPYPAISLHATQRLYNAPNGSYSTTAPEPSSEAVHAIYLQLDPLYLSRDQMNEDVDDGGAEATLSIVPPPFGGQSGQSNSENAGHIFEALSNCADLHPDPNLDDEDNDGSGLATLGGVGSMPGAGGWITAENAHEFEDQFADADHDETGAETDENLGPGAGNKRDNVDANGAEAEDEGKWQRTS